MKGVNRAAGATLALSILLAVAAVDGVAAEEIAVFDVELFLERNGGVAIVEEITYDFGGEKRHGIYRDIPVRYDRDWKTQHRLDLEVEEVTRFDGTARPYRVEGDSSVVRIKVGDANRWVSPREEYRIRYRVKEGVVFLDEHDELYWDITGNEWTIPIRTVRARVHLPPGLEATGLQTRCFTGVHGSSASNCTVFAEGGSVRFEAAGLGPSEGLTVAVALPKGVFEEPTQVERAFRSFLAWGGPWLFAPLVAFGWMQRRWRRHGQDVGIGDSIPVRYEPPEGLTPAEVGTLIDESADMEDVTATILDLAVRGFLEIEEVETTKLLFLTDKDYTLHAKRSADDTLKPHERFLLSALFKSGATSVELSSLKNHFYEDVPGLQEALYQGLAKEGGYFPASPEDVRKRWRGFAIALAIAAIGCWAFLGLPPAAGVAALSCGAIVFFFAPHMPQRTRRGRKAYEEILGFQEFMARVDRDRLERMGGRDAGHFERCLPYAVVLGVADQWAEAFEGIYTEPPDWYRSDRYRGGFYPRHFVSDVGHSLQTMGQTFASRPSNAGSTGFSSGGAFGGGGFSGGGFGGGGGGSW
ncbi:MAG: DUF2207 domain-containing protein [Myxococcales bacterium]|nr:DUF2207 domain-containing protein [Myxococcales bacterium]